MCFDGVVEVDLSELRKYSVLRVQCGRTNELVFTNWVIIPDLYFYFAVGWESDLLSQCKIEFRIIIVTYILVLELSKRNKTLISRSPRLTTTYGSDSERTSLFASYLA